MFFLVLDVDFQILHVPGAYGKVSVTVLPIEVLQLRLDILDPFGGVSLDVSDKSCDSNCLREAAKDMDVIFSAADIKGRAFLVVANPGQIGMQAQSKFAIGEKCVTVFR
jgi:hypothetical protein